MFAGTPFHRSEQVLLRGMHLLLADGDGCFQLLGRLCKSPVRGVFRVLQLAYQVQVGKFGPVAGQLKLGVAELGQLPSRCQRLGIAAPGSVSSFADVQ